MRQPEPEILWFEIAPVVIAIFGIPAHIFLVKYLRAPLLEVFVPDHHSLVLSGFLFGEGKNFNFYFHVYVF